jgi:hypothetical protein
MAVAALMVLAQQDQVALELLLFLTLVAKEVQVARSQLLVATQFIHLHLAVHI